MNLCKLQLDRDAQDETQATIVKKVDEIGSRYLKENVKWIGNSLNANNFSQCKQRLQDVVERCRGIGFQVTPEEEACTSPNYALNLKWPFVPRFSERSKHAFGPDSRRTKTRTRDSA